MEFSISAKNLASVKEKMTEDLAQGLEFAAQLKLFFHNQLTGTAAVSAMEVEDLVTRISRSFTEALSLLNYTQPGKVSPTVKQPSWDQHEKPSKRRKMQETWTRITSELIEDGYSWRKYGQKHILNSKHLRCYYRCSNRFDQGCQATKQVQRTDLEDKLPTFWTKYVSQHTCQNILKLSMDMDSTDEEGFLINFESNTTNRQDPLFFSAFPSSEAENEKSFTSTGLQECVISSGDSSSSSGNFDMDFDLKDFVYLNDVFDDDKFS